MGVGRRGGAVRRGGLRGAALVASLSLSLLLPVTVGEVGASPRAEVTVM
jgi:hypothetical protein